MSNSGDDPLITIGVLARASGLTPSAIRFYGDCGLLAPATVDDATGYRYYTAAQRERAVTIRQLRAIDIPLDAVAVILSSDDDTAGRLLDEHVTELERRAHDAAAVTASVKASLRSQNTVTLSAAALAAAVEVVCTAAASSTDIAVLTGLFLETRSNALTLTATDRYRLTTRSLALHREARSDWSMVVVSGDLAAVAPALRDLDIVSLTPTSNGLLVSGAGAEFFCETIGEPYPDYRTMIDRLAPVVTRVVVAREAMLATIDEAGGASLQCSFSEDRATVSSRHEGARRIPATVIGPRFDISFDPATLRPAIATAVGPDLMLDLARPDQPVILRSGNDGDLTTLVMPRKPDHLLEGVQL